MTSTLTDLERRLVELERELSSVAGAALAPAPSPSPPVPPPSPAPPRVSAPPRASAPPVAPAPRASPSPPAPSVIEAGPFDGIGAVARFEQQLRDLPGVAEAKVRRYKNGHAVIDVLLEGAG